MWIRSESEVSLGSNLHMNGLVLLYVPTLGDVRLSHSAVNPGIYRLRFRKDRLPLIGSRTTYIVASIDCADLESRPNIGCYQERLRF